MTNTLHRHGNSASLAKDYVVFAIACRGYNDRNCVPRLQEFLRRARRHRPVNLGDASHGSVFRPDNDLGPLSHWHRRETRDFDAVIDGVSTPTTVAAVFEDREAVIEFLKEIRGADLGLSVNLSATIAGAAACCREAGIARHSVEYSLRYMGQTGLLAESRVLEIATMCGHSMISFDFARKMIDWVREGRRSPERAAAYLARFCTCGIFNPSRASEILRQVSCGR
jgi:hypothetical protein